VRFQFLGQTATVLSLGLLSVTVFSILTAQSKPVSNEDVKEMIRNGLSESIIVKVIQTSPARFDASPGALIALKNTGATEGVIDAVLRASTAATPAPSPNSAPQPSEKRARGREIPPLHLGSFLSLQLKGPCEISENDSASGFATLSHRSPSFKEPFRTVSYPSSAQFSDTRLFRR